MQQFERHPKWDLFRISVNGFQCYMGSGCSYKPKNSSHRLGIAAVFLGSFLFSMTLSTIIMMFITTPSQDTQVESIEEIISRDFQLVGDQFVYQKISQQNQVVVFF